MTRGRHAQLVAALDEGEKTTSELVERLHVHRITVRRLLQELLAEGEAEQTVRGRYRRAGARPLIGKDALAILAAVEQLAPDAHLTGFDVLAPLAHQFFVEYPHLVYVEPASSIEAAFRLAAAGFVVVPASGRAGAAVKAEPGKTVVLREQPNAERYGVHGPIASREKAWVDTLRESHRGNLPFDYVELGRVLRALLDRDGDMRRLRNYARRMGYAARLDAAWATSRDLATDAMAEQLRAGFWS